MPLLITVAVLLIAAGAVAAVVRPAAVSRPGTTVATRHIAYSILGG